jgi:hypothetical protein
VVVVVVVVLVTDAEVTAVIATRTPDELAAFNGMETLWTLVKIVSTGCTTVVEMAPPTHPEMASTKNSLHFGPMFWPSSVCFSFIMRVLLCE